MIAAAYVINLAADRARWQDMQPVLDAIGIAERIRVEAVNGAALDADALQALRAAGRLAATPDGFDRHARAGEIGCALSHAAVLADIVARRLPAALVLEDDVLLAGGAAGWRDRFDGAFADLPDGWELWYLYRCLDVEHRTRRLSPRLVVPWRPLGGAAYAVTLAGAEKLLAAMTPVSVAVDRAYERLVHARGIDAYAASPLLVRAGDHASVINRANPTRRWVRRGINRPPEYWPDRYLAHLGETAPRRSPVARAWRALRDALP